MGLPKETRDFFTNKINAVLDKKLENVRKDIDQEVVTKEATERFCKKYGFWSTSIARFEEIQEQKKALDAEAEKIVEAGERAIEKSGASSRNYRWSVVSNIKQASLEKFETDVLEELYPNLLASIEKIQKIKDDVYGVVLLATTEPKLVARLSQVLKNYGGDMQELLDLLPKE